MISLADDNPKKLRHKKDLAVMLATCRAVQFRDEKRAIALAKEMLQVEPDSAVHWGVLGMAQYEAGDFSEAIQSLEKATNFAGEDRPTDYDYLAMAYWKKGDRQQARQWFEKAAAWFDKTKYTDMELKYFHDQAANLLNEGMKPPAD